MSLTAFIGRCPHCGHDHGENALFDVALGTLTPSQQAQVNERFANYAKQKPHLYGGCDEITTLREQVKKLKAELKSIDGALDDPRANLTLTTSEIIWELKEQVEKLTKERDDLRSRRCEVCGYLEHEREHTGCLREQLAALAEQNEKMRKVLLRLACLGNGDQYGNSIGNCIAQEALSLPNLASPVLNRIKAEAYREAAEIVGPEDSYQDDWFKAKADSCAKLLAKADELQ